MKRRKGTENDLESGEAGVQLKQLQFCPELLAIFHSRNIKKKQQMGKIFPAWLYIKEPDKHQWKLTFFGKSLFPAEDGARATI